MPNEGYLVVWEGLGGREGEQARRLPGWVFGWCGAAGAGLSAPSMREVGAVGWCRWRWPMSGSCWWLGGL